jgi:uncharacterized protein (DUF58 family)
MFTSRGRWFLLLVCVMLAVAVLGQYLFSGNWAGDLSNVASVALIALTLLTWFTWERLAFLIQSRLTLRRLQIVREVCDERGPVETLWAGRTFRVRVEVTVPTGMGLAHVVLTDRIPFGSELASLTRQARTAGELGSLTHQARTADELASLARQARTVEGEGQPRYQGALRPGQPAIFTYQIRCQGVGTLRFEGLTLQMADLQGFFYHTTFLRRVVQYPVLPSLLDVGGSGQTVKRHNLLLPPGIHRHRRPGSGTELLDLRDYRPGDPPKTIAWKVSARRDRLMTKEFESEVPVRCTLFVDTSDSVRVGPPGRNALGPLVEIAAAVTQAAMDRRDLTGLCRFDERGSTYVRPARGARHLVRLLNLLAEAGSLAPAAGEARVRKLLPLGYALAWELYPDYLQADLNRFPFWLAWLWPPAPYTLLRPGASDYVYHWLPFLLPLYGLVGFILIGMGFFNLADLLGDFGLPPERLLIFLAGAVIASLFLFIRIPSAWFFPRRRRWLRWRKQLAALLSVRYGLAPGGLGLLLEDDERFGFYLQRFLSEHHVPYPLPLYDRQGRYVFASPGKVKVLASALLRSVGKGHDNELFVLLADLLELTDELEPLLRAVKVALARHHRVMLVCPWPPGIERPSGSRFEAEPLEGPGLGRILKQTTSERFHRAFYRLRRTFGGLGVPVVCAGRDDSARLILERLDALRQLGRT